MDTPITRLNIRVDPQTSGAGFHCSVCSCRRPLQELLDLDCSCLVCSTCCDKFIAARLVQVPATNLAELEVAVYSVGQKVIYRQRDGAFISAKIMQVDRSIEPYGYGILLEGAVDIRFTERTRLLPSDLHQEAPAAWMEQGVHSSPG